MVSCWISQFDVNCSMLRLFLWSCLQGEVLKHFVHTRKLLVILWKWKLPSHVQLFATQWTVARQAPLFMEFPRQEYWSGLPFPSPGDPPNPGIEPMSPVSPPLAGRFFTTKPPGKSLRQMNRSKTSVITYIQGSHKNIRAWDFPLWSSGEESTFQCRQFRFHPW